MQKTTIDACGNIKIETYDALDHLVLCEKKNPQGATVAKEAYFYDTSGNRAKRVSLVYELQTPVKEICTVWEYDCHGHVIKEVEANQKTTFYTYDSRGWLHTKTLPSGIVLTHSYDGIGRLLHLSSSDATIDYQHLYDIGPEPIKILDARCRLTLERSYNLFGQVVKETNPYGLSYQWKYDALGRCVELSLPDASSIHYSYLGGHLHAVHRVSAEGKQRYEHRYTQFDPNGHVQEEQLIHSLGQVITAHDLLERPSRQSSSLMDQSISYGPSGLVDQIHNSIFGTKDYLYDPLNQITQESNQRYSFNSFGNPIGCEVNDCNQILSTSDSKLNYDPDGNPIQRIKEGDCTSYRYDALGRLVEIRTTQKKVHYSYDPLSRLISKETFNLQSGKWSRQKILYLYDQEKEIGTCTIHHDILELKVLGLGIKGDIGGAIAIEIGQEVYVPFHDFNGHVILLISSEGKVVEKNLIDAFGKQTTDPSSKNPWRFCSKRCEEDLIFFGKRFYDPSLGRWLTPDPAGFTEGPNLYVYVLNNPINRLDLFGLRSDPIYPWTNGQGEPNIEVEISRIPTAANVKEVLVCKGAVGDVEVDWIVSCSNWHKLQFTPEELNAGKINIIDHFYEIMPKDGMIIGLITAQNGIMTNLGELKVMGDSIIDKIPESSLFIGMHNPTLGFVSDLRRVRAEKKGVDTPIVCRTRQFMEAIVDRVHNLNPNLLWMHISHSEGGLIAYRALEGMTPEHKEQLKEHLLSVSLGPAHPIPKSLAKGAVNYYSNKDYITKWFGEPFINDKDYDIRVVECVSSRDEMNGGIADHKFHGSTYQRSLNIEVSDSRIKYGFYDEQKR